MTQGPAKTTALTVSLPGSATDNAIVRFDGASGNSFQNSGVTIDDSNNVAGAANITATSVNAMASSTEHAIVRFDGTTGKLQNSGVIVDDSNNVSGVAQLDATAAHITTVLADHIGEHTGAHGVVFDNQLKTDHIAENTVSHGVVFDNNVHFPAGTVGAPSIALESNSGIYLINAGEIGVCSGGAIVVDFLGGIFGTKFFGAVYPSDNKATNLGRTGSAAWDNVYADDFVNECSVYNDRDCLEIIRNIKSKGIESDGSPKMDIQGLPEFLTPLAKIKRKKEWKLLEKMKDKENWEDLTEEEQRLMKSGRSMKAFSDLHTSAIQQLLAKVETLEAKITELEKKNG